MTGDDGYTPVEMSADYVAPSARAAGSASGLHVEIEGLTWNDVEIEWPAPEIAEEVFAAWLERWFDPDDRPLRQQRSNTWKSAWAGCGHLLG